LPVVGLAFAPGLGLVFGDDPPARPPEAGASPSAEFPPDLPHAVNARAVTAAKDSMPTRRLIVMADIAASYVLRLFLRR
jgi:hypothetical protein